RHSCPVGCARYRGLHKTPAKAFFANSTGRLTRSCRPRNRGLLLSISPKHSFSVLVRALSSRFAIVPLSLRRTTEPCFAEKRRRLSLRRGRAVVRRVLPVFAGTLSPQKGRDSPAMICPLRPPLNSA